MVMAPWAMHDSAVSFCFHGCLPFPPQSPPSHPLGPSLSSQQQPSPWDCSTYLNSSSQLRHLLKDQHPCRGTYGCGKDCLIHIPFRLPQISCFPLSLKCFSSDSDNCPNVGTGPLLQFRHPPRAGRVLPTPVFHASSFVLPSFAWVYIFFPTGQVLLSTLHWCSGCTSVSEGVFLMYPRRDIYSTFTYFSAILF